MICWTSLTIKENHHCRYGDSKPGMEKNILSRMRTIGFKNILAVLIKQPA